MVSTDLYQWQRVSGTAAGTTVVKAEPGNLKTIIMGQNKTGTATFYDHASGTSATSLMFILQNTSGTSPLALDINCRFKNGLVAETGGTTDMTVIYS